MPETTVNRPRVDSSKIVDNMIDDRHDGISNIGKAWCEQEGDCDAIIRDTKENIANGYWTDHIEQMTVELLQPIQ